MPADPNAGKPGEGKPPEGEGKQPPDSAKAIADLQAANAALLERLTKLEGKGKEPPPTDPDLQERARKERERLDKEKNDVKALEKALTFNLNSKAWLADNASLLPKEISDIFATADKENFDSAIEKDRAVKSGIVQTFFAVQSNLDLLTASQKTVVEDYLKLTKQGKQDQAQALYDTIFEPAFETLRKLKKAEALNLNHSTHSDKNYENRMMKLSRQHYLGEK